MDAATLWRKTAPESQSFAAWRKLVMDKLVADGLISGKPHDTKAEVFEATEDGCKLAKKMGIDMQNDQLAHLLPTGNLISKMEGVYQPERIEHARLC